MVEADVASDIPGEGNGIVKENKKMEEDVKEVVEDVTENEKQVKDVGEEDVKVVVEDVVEKEKQVKDEGGNMEEENETETNKAEENKEEVDEKIEAEAGKKDKKSKKRRRTEVKEEKEGEKKKEQHVKKAKEPVTPVVPLNRPVRERKSVERLVASIEKEPSKELLIRKGRGTALKDIPNVAYKLSRKRTDETFKLLHVILFGRRGKAFNIKNNLSQFSGFVWHENEEKQRLKVKEKFDKYVKEKLLEFCDVLDIHVTRATSRKEDIVTKLLDFLEAPCATTDILLAEKELLSKGTKRKKAIQKTVPKKRRKVADDTPITEKNVPETEESEDKDGEENTNGIPGGSEDVAEKSDPEEKEGESEEETVKQKQDLKETPLKEPSKKTKSKKIATPKKATPIVSPEKSSLKSTVKRHKDADGVDKKKDGETSKTAKKKSTTPETTTKKDRKEKTGKKVTKEKSKLKEKSGPTEVQIRDVVCNILKEVDFNTATFTDILKKLAGHFGVDLTPKKADIKLIIQEELTKHAGEEEDEDDEEDPDSAAEEADA
ncbi:hypothetical protein IFM89_009403 [Coptis chinensis]|uniref:DEK-C domain-containing protein n=1 Tax=Coptis chinensis TaxID=261450 RepID=A0A835H0A8_9MAGN|nr:hypothetical protein IFM89_009403 [Coptis chinensis]